MKVLVDTSVWSLALRRRAEDLNPEQAALVAALTDLIGDGRVVMIGVIRQELLSGVREPAAFERLRTRLRVFEDEPLTTDDFESAAAAHNECRRAGVSGSAIDFLICAVAVRMNVPVFTTDLDFSRYASALPISLYNP